MTLSLYKIKRLANYINRYKILCNNMTLLTLELDKDNIHLKTGKYTNFKLC